jgi:hypothetical protein
VDKYGRFDVDLKKPIDIAKVIEELDTTISQDVPVDELDCEESECVGCRSEEALCTVGRIRQAVERRHWVADWLATSQMLTKCVQHPPYAEGKDTLRRITKQENGIYNKRDV